MNDDWHATRRGIDDVLAALPPDRRFHYPIRHGSMRVGLYCPLTMDDQTPHDQDELYIVASGTGWFIRGSDRVAYAAGDIFFVPAGLPHRFEDFTPDFVTWVVFYGSPGGE